MPPLHFRLLSTLLEKSMYEPSIDSQPSAELGSGPILAKIGNNNFVQRWVAQSYQVQI